MSRVLLIGQAPGRGGQGPLFPSATGHRLLTLAGCDLEKFKAHFEVVNLFEFSLEPREAMREQLTGRRVLFVGHASAGAFGFKPRPWLAWRWHQHPAHGGAFLWAVMPHPSGVGHFYNDPGNRAIAGSFLRRAMEESL